ncbi:MAG: hypothetical protein M0R06_09300 [Sphaerochaeta sp.]|jgi:hypothetical protein|nr:hypothetical protein [Sphaerochaeta sp.]
MTILGVVIIAFIVEAVWETLKMVWQQGKVSVDRIGALAVGLLVAFASGVDLFALVEVPLQVPYVGLALTGILISRGANFVHDLLKKIQPSS